MFFLSLWKLKGCIDEPAPVAPVQLMVGMIISGDAHRHRMTSLIEVSSNLTVPKKAFDLYSDWKHFFFQKRTLRAAKLRVSFYQLLHSGQIKYLRVGQVYRIPKLCVIDFLEKETKAAK